MTKASHSKPKKIRCAIYTRKSHEEGLDQEFNSLDSQRDAAENYIASQSAEGWVALPTRYDDGGFSGGNLERPAMKRLLADIEAGEVDCVVVYKVDRLSRSLLDFARIMGTLDEQNVSFVSVTQHFNTTHSMGRLTLNILLSFAQFEREIIGERIRDKIAGQRRRGKWAGGVPVLGYDVDRSERSPKLVINDDEAVRVRRIFAMYLEMGSILPVVQECERRGWLNKAWVTRGGKSKGGRPFDKSAIHAMLTNPLYAGRIRHKDQTFKGEHAAIVDKVVFEETQRLLKSNSRGRGNAVSNKHDALLRGLLFCPKCRLAMVHNIARRKTKLYRYYTCQTAIKRGYKKCPFPSLPAGEMENAVVEHIRRIGSDTELRREVLTQSQTQAAGELEDLGGQDRLLTKQLSQYHAELEQLSAKSDASSKATDRLALLHEQIASAERSLATVRADAEALQDREFKEHDINAAFGDFDNVWKALTVNEKSQVLKLLIERIEFDVDDSSIAITLHPSGIKSLSAAHEPEKQEATA
ncbi:recombinase family protein [Crateriforma spongiae]|uniref:recombinase family protein n=1 Tax=Crateriforma spongiae TaxID=2724528 RepID=UPI0039AF64AE